MNTHPNSGNSSSANSTLGRWSAPVVVGFADSPIASQRPALRFAAAQANQRRTNVRLVHACLPLTTPAVTEPTVSVAELTRRGHELLSGAAAELERLLDPGREIECVVTPDTSSESLVAFSQDASIVVLQRRDVSAMTRLRTGSTTSRVCAQSTAPVAVIKTDLNPLDDREGVVVGVDHRGHTHAALDVAFTEASLTRQPLIALHAYELPGPTTAYGYVPPTPEEQALVRGNARADLAEALAGFGEQHPDVEIRRHVVHTTPTDALLDASSRAKLLVVGRHSQHGVASIGLGGVARHCLQHALCPVIVVPPTVVARRTSRWSVPDASIQPSY